MQNNENGYIQQHKMFFFIHFIIFLFNQDSFESANKRFLLT